MKERPALFSAPMVQAIRADRKTQTRRPVKGEPLDWLDDAGFTPDFVASPENHLSPYGYAGDRLWVKENYRLDVAYDAEPARALDERAAVWYEADGTQAGGGVPGKLRPSIFLRRVWSRELLEVGAVRIERLQDISESDAIAEGLECFNFTGWGGEPGIPSPMEPDVFRGWDRGEWEESPVAAYAALWDHINGAGAWAANPWVWVVPFRRIGP